MKYIWNISNFYPFIYLLSKNKISTSKTYHGGFSVNKVRFITQRLAFLVSYMVSETHSFS